MEQSAEGGCSPLSSQSSVQALREAICPLPPPHSDVKGEPPKEEFYLQLSEPLFLSLAGGVGMDNLLY